MSNTMPPPVPQQPLPPEGGPGPWAAPMPPGGPMPNGGPVPPFQSGTQAPPMPPMPPYPPVQPAPRPRGGGKPIGEKRAFSINGLVGLLILLAAFGYEIFTLIGAVGEGGDNNPTVAGISIVVMIVLFLLSSCFTIIQPGDTKVLQFLGSYVGTVRATGLRMTYPFCTKRRVSVKVRNFETREIKVNDSQGNPVVIGAIIVWQVRDTAQSVFQVEYYEQFVQVQAEAALRHIATIHPYDNGDPGEATLRGATDQVAAELAREVGERVTIAGVEIVETRISSLSYAPEIASAMLQRQQAQAVLAARAKIVEGAVTMVESALSRIEAENIVKLDEDRKATMVSNLLVVLCSDSRAMPTVNTGL